MATCSEEILFSHIIFQPESDIKIFIDKFLQVMKQGKKFKKSVKNDPTTIFGRNIFNELKDSTKAKAWLNDNPGIGHSKFQVGWLKSEEVYKEIGVFLKRLTQFTVYKYNGKEFKDLVGAIRDLNAHEFMEERDSHSGLVEARQVCADKLRDQPYYFWLKNFPDLIFQLYAAGFQDQISQWKSSAELMDYLNRFYVDNNKFERTIFSTLNQFVSRIADTITLDSDHITERFMQAINCNGKQIRILKNPNDHPRLRNTSQPGEMVFISFEIKDKVITKFTLERKQRDGKRIGSILEMEVPRNGESPVEWNKEWNPMIILTKDVRTAVYTIERDESIKQNKILIYTSKQYDRIRDIFNDSFIVSHKSFVRQELDWREVESNLKKELLEKEFKLFLNSPKKEKIKLENIFQQPLTSSVENSFEINDPYGSIIPSLIHGNVLLSSHIHEPESYIKRWLKILKTGEKIYDEEFVKDCLPGTGNLSIIKGVLGMGKSTLLAKLGGTFIKNGWIATYCTAKDVVNKWEKERPEKTAKQDKLAELKVRLFFPYVSNFEWKILRKLVKSNLNLRFIVLLDGLEEISEEKIKTCLQIVEESFQNQKTGATLQFIIASQPAQVEALSKKFTNSILYDMVSFNPKDETHYLFSNWKIYAKNADDKKKIRKLIDFLRLYDKPLPEIKGTPLACMLRSKMYIEYAQNLKRELKLENVHDLCDILEQLIEFRLKIHLHKFFGSTDAPYLMKDYSSWFLDIPKAVLKSICEQRAIQMLFPKEKILLPNYYPFEIPELANIHEFGLLEDVNVFVIEKMQTFFSASLFLKSLKRSDSNLLGVLEFFLKNVLPRANEGYLLMKTNENSLENSKVEPDLKNKTCMEILKILDSLIKNHEDKPSEILGEMMQKLTDYETISQSLGSFFQNSNFKLFQIFVYALQSSNFKVEVENKCRDISQIQMKKQHVDAFLKYIEGGDLVITEFLLLVFKIDPNLADSSTGHTPLHTAVTIKNSKKRVQMVELLKRNLANICVSDIKGKTPFELACTHACENTLKILLRKYDKNFVLAENMKKIFIGSVRQAKRLPRAEIFSIQELLKSLNSASLFQSTDLRTE